MCVCALLAAATDAPAPSDFAFALPIHAEGNAPAYRVALPPTVYQGVTRADLADLCVFDADGKPVPYALRTEPAAAAQTLSAVLPLFPIPGGVRASEDLAVRVERRADGTIVNVHSARGAVEPSHVVAYVADASLAARPLRALTLQWQDPKSYGFVGRVRVEGSDDLRDWSLIAPDAPMSRLRHDGRLLEQRRVAFVPVAVKYLRITWLTPASGAKLVGVTAELLGADPPPPRAWVPVALSQAEVSGAFRFTLADTVPADRVRIGLPPGNAFYDVEVLSRDGAKAPWQSRGEGLTYRLQTPGGVVSQDELSLRPGRGREWLVRGERGSLPATLTIAVGFTPHEIVFLAQGRPPFKLAYGSARTVGRAFDVGQLLQPFKGGAAAAIAPASFGSVEVLGGERVTRAPVPSRWRQWLLWSVLVLGVALLGGMALRLVRQMNG